MIMAGYYRSALFFFFFGLFVVVVVFIKFSCSFVIGHIPMSFHILPSLDILLKGKTKKIYQSPWFHFSCAWMKFSDEMHLKKRSRKLWHTLYKNYIWCISCHLELMLFCYYCLFFLLLLLLLFVLLLLLSSSCCCCFFLVGGELLLLLFLFVLFFFCLPTENILSYIDWQIPIPILFLIKVTFRTFSFRCRVYLLQFNKHVNLLLLGHFFFQRFWRDHYLFHQ